MSERQKVLRPSVASVQSIYRSLDRALRAGSHGEARQNVARAMGALEVLLGENVPEGEPDADPPKLVGWRGGVAPEPVFEDETSVAKGLMFDCAICGKSVPDLDQHLARAHPEPAIGRTDIVEGVG